MFYENLFKKKCKLLIRFQTYLFRFIHTFTFVEKNFCCKMGLAKLDAVLYLSSAFKLILEITCFIFS